MSIEPLPSTGVSKILSVVELLADHDGADDLFRLAQDLHTPFGELLLIIKGAEMLALVETTGNRATLTPLGRQALEATLADKKRLLRERMLTLRIFQHVQALLDKRPEHEVAADALLEQLAVLLPHEPPRQLFTTLLNWGRYSEIFAYARDTDRIVLYKAA